MLLVLIWELAREQRAFSQFKAWKKCLPILLGPHFVNSALERCSKNHCFYIIKIGLDIAVQHLWNIYIYY